MSQGYDRGWRRYSFAESTMRPVHAHGSDLAVLAALAFNRGPGELQMSLLELPPHERGCAIDMHVHRDVPTGRDAEEIYIVVQGVCVMTFSSGAEVRLTAGDAVTTYPGTGHAVRVVGEQSVRIVVIVPHAFRAAGAAGGSDRLPARFEPRVEVGRCDPTALTPLDARCTVCEQEWVASSEGGSSGALAEWASGHLCESVGPVSGALDARD